jgi:hypothetical protein
MKALRQTVDLSAYPDLVVIYLGMTVNMLAGIKTLFGFGPKIEGSVAARPDGLLLHENIFYSLFPLHIGMRLNTGAILNRLNALDYFFTPRTASFAALATRNLTTVLAGILIFCCVFGLKPERAFLFCFTSLPKPGKTNSPFFLISL